MRTEPLIGLSQENLIGFQVQTNLPYISQTMVCVHTTLSYSKVYMFAIRSIYCYHVI